jgi:hypothetical protein
VKESKLLGISLYIIFLPIITLLLIKAVLLLPGFQRVELAVHPFRFLYNYTVFGGSWRTGWVRVALYIILGMGVSYSYNPARIGAITLTLATAVLGAIELVRIYLQTSHVIFDYVAKAFGLEDVFLPLLIHLIFILANLFAAFYLTRPRVKALFTK